MIGISQSGETADTLAAMRTARERGASVLALTNIMGSQATREADGVLYTRAGLEIGVAATKTFVSQVAACYLLALRLAELRGTLAPDVLTDDDHRAQAPAASDRADPRAAGSTTSSGSRSRTTGPTSSCIWADTSGCRWRSRAR